MGVGDRNRRGRLRGFAAGALLSVGAGLAQAAPPKRDAPPIEATPREAPTPAPPAPDDLKRRPTDLLQAELAALEADEADWQRRLRALNRAADTRRGIAARRLRVLYQATQGGGLRLALGVDRPLAVYQQRDGARRVLQRDLDELRGLRAELTQVNKESEPSVAQRERAAELRAELQRRRALATEEDPAPAGPGRLRGQLLRPVPGAVSARFGSRDRGPSLELYQHGVTFATPQPTVVRSVAAGTVRYVGAVAGRGSGVIIEHEPRLLTLYAPLSAIAVATGDHLGGGTRLGLSVGDEVYLQLQVDGLPLDPLPWLSTLKGAAAAPGKPHTEKEKEKEKEKPRPRRRRERP